MGPAVRHEVLEAVGSKEEAHKTGTLAGSRSKGLHPVWWQLPQLERGTGSKIKTFWICYTSENAIGVNSVPTYVSTIAFMMNVFECLKLQVNAL